MLQTFCLVKSHPVENSARLKGYPVDSVVKLKITAR